MGFWRACHTRRVHYTSNRDWLTKEEGVVKEYLTEVLYVLALSKRTERQGQETSDGGHRRGGLIPSSSMTLRPLLIVAER